jgi:hypothetical protein
MGKIAFVEDHQAHHMKRHVDVPAPPRFEDPARGDPTPRTQWFEPEIDAGFDRHRGGSPSGGGSFGVGGESTLTMYIKHLDERQGA